jgi:hypothetical protein
VLFPSGGSEDDRGPAHVLLAGALWVLWDQYLYFARFAAPVDLTDEGLEAMTVTGERVSIPWRVVRSARFEQWIDSPNRDFWVRT